MLVFLGCLAISMHLFSMANLEYEYLQMRRELVMKYGYKAIMSPANKALALILLTRSFKRVPNDVPFQAELEMLAKPFDNMLKPEVSRQLNELQSEFRRNRFIEIINENPDNLSIHNPLHVTPEARIAAVESLGVTSSDSMSKPLATGQTLGELVGDLYQLYLVEYRAFRKNRRHPIFCLVEEGDVGLNIKQSAQPTRTKKSENKGCLGILVTFLLLTSYVVVITVDWNNFKIFWPL
ncbi:MAG: hypothetical protein EOO04_21000 [Chitinophagaceae bacterium]|nr:MAG: hypothetical protein EOO04_21000 [Chitinophagaceae bacterium]